MSPEGEKPSEAIIIWAAFVFLALALKLSASSSFHFFPDLTGTLPLAATNPEWILEVSISTSFFFFLSIIFQGASVTQTEGAVDLWQTIAKQDELVEVHVLYPSISDMLWSMGFNFKTHSFHPGF